MTFEEEMDRFYKPYPAENRATVEMSEEYKAAAKDRDVVKAQEIAVAMLQGRTTFVRTDPITRHLLEM